MRLEWVLLNTCSGKYFKASFILRAKDFHHEATEEASDSTRKPESSIDRSTAQGSKKKKKRTLESIINKFIKTNCIKKKKSLQRSETRVVDGERARGRRGGGKSLDRPLDRIKTSTWKLSSRVELRGVKIHTYVLKVEFRWWGIDQFEKQKLQRQSTQCHVVLFESDKEQKKKHT